MKNIKEMPEIADNKNIKEMPEIADNKNKNDFKSKVCYGMQINRATMSIIYNYINLLADYRMTTGDNTLDGITFNGVINTNDYYKEALPSTTDGLWVNKVLLNYFNLNILLRLVSIKENGDFNMYASIYSLEDTEFKGEFLYKYILDKSIVMSNLKGSYLILKDKKFDWEIKTLEHTSFDEIYLPENLLVDLSMFYKTYETKGVIPKYMLSGVPGTGKTESTRAIASYLNKNGVTVIKTNICDVIKEKVELAKILAPSLIIFDDIDLYLGDRNNGNFSRLLGEFLDILDGVDKLPDNVGIIATTNAPHLIDLAAQRPGRFNKLLFFDELTIDNIKSIIIKSLDSMNNKYYNVTENERELLTQDKFLTFLKDKGFTGSFIYEIIKDIKNKVDILEDEINIDKIIANISKDSSYLDAKLREGKIKNNLKGKSNSVGY